MIRKLISSPIKQLITSPIGVSVGGAPGLSSIADLFANGEYGAWYDISDTSTLYQDSAGTIAVTSDGDPVGLVQDKSGNGANATQSTSAARPVYNVTPDRLTLDKVDDNMSVNLASPVSGSMIMALNNGIIVAEISASSNWELTSNPAYFPDNGIANLLIIDRVLTSNEINFVKSTFGGVNDFSGVSSMTSWFRDRTDIVAIDAGLWDTSSVTNMSYFALSCANLTQLNVSNWDTSSVTTFLGFIYATNLSTLDISDWDTSSCTSFRSFARFATNLTSVILDGGAGNPFADSPCIDYISAFSNTSLTQQSIDNILVAINAAGTSNGTFDQSGGSAPSATGEAAIDALRSRGWTINVTGGY